jgi:iron-sulfur cluster repair protein YtfE (RIC family)
MTDTSDRREHPLQTGEIDFTMMYAAHDAFSRELRRITLACARGHALTPETRARWAMFAKQLHIHHTAEDSFLWPRLRAAISEPAEVGVLDAMQTEHARIDPQLERIDTALAAHDPATVTDAVHTLTLDLTAHMKNEEDQALRLVETHLGRDGWSAFGRDMRRGHGGIRGLAQYLPWLLDDAPATTRTKVLSLLPAPAKLLYRRSWAPRYRRTAP